MKSVERIPGSAADCPRCRAESPANAQLCPHCGLFTVAAPAEEMQLVSEDAVDQMQKRTAKPTIGGALLIIAGVLEVLTGAVTAIYGRSLAEMAGNLAVSDLVVYVGVAMLLFGTVAIIGGAVAVMRRFWGLALIGGVLSILGLGPSFYGAVLGLIGLVLIAASRREFRRA